MKKRHTLPIGRIVEEGRDVKTFTFFHDLGARPGQFVMITDFQGGEKPFSIGESRRGEFSITVKRVGEFTRRLFCLKSGDLISIRGAYGSSFFMSPGKTLLIGGGYGSPPLTCLADSLKEAGSQVTVINGARTEEDLIMGSRFGSMDIRYLETTDDGSRGEKGSVVELAKKEMAEQDYDYLYAAGPEMMMKNLMASVGSMNYQFLMERYMKCAVGLCGACVMDPTGIRVCREGPVLDRRQLSLLTEFGSYHRDASGKKIEY